MIPIGIYSDKSMSNTLSLFISPLDKPLLYRLNICHIQIKLKWKNEMKIHFLVVRKELKSGNNWLILVSFASPLMSSVCHYPYHSFLPINTEIKIMHSDEVKFKLRNSL
jgi:hypothetical protein